MKTFIGSVLDTLTDVIIVVGFALALIAGIAVFLVPLVFALGSKGDNGNLWFLLIYLGYLVIGVVGKGIYDVVQERRRVASEAISHRNW